VNNETEILKGSYKKDNVLNKNYCIFQSWKSCLCSASYVESL